LDKQEVFAIHHRLAVLVRCLTDLDLPAMAGPLGVVGLAPDRHPGADRVAGKDRCRKAQPFVAVGHGARIDLGRRQTDADGEGHGAVRDALAEGLGAAELGIHVVGEEIPEWPA